MVFKQLGWVALLAAGWVNAATDFVAVPYRLVNVQAASINGQVGQRVTVATGRAGELCELLLNEKSAQGGRFESQGRLNRDIGFQCVRDGVTYSLSSARHTYVRGAVAPGAVSLEARLMSVSGQALDVRTTQPINVSL